MSQLTTPPKSNQEVRMEFAKRYAGLLKAQGNRYLVEGHLPERFPNEPVYYAKTDIELGSQKMFIPIESQSGLRILENNIFEWEGDFWSQEMDIARWDDYYLAFPEQLTSQN